MSNCLEGSEEAAVILFVFLLQQIPRGGGVSPFTALEDLVHCDRRLWGSKVAHVMAAECKEKRCLCCGHFLDPSLRGGDTGTRMGLG